jgi:hypothetical protein
MVKPLPYHSPSSFVRYLFTLTVVKVLKNGLFYRDPRPVGEGLRKGLIIFQAQPRAVGEVSL